MTKATQSMTDMTAADAVSEQKILKTIKMNGRERRHARWEKEAGREFYMNEACAAEPEPNTDDQQQPMAATEDAPKVATKDGISLGGFVDGMLPERKPAPKSPITTARIQPQTVPAASSEPTSGTEIGLREEPTGADLENAKIMAELRQERGETSQSSEGPIYSTGQPQNNPRIVLTGCKPFKVYDPVEKTWRKHARREEGQQSAKSTAAAGR